MFSVLFVFVVVFVVVPVVGAVVLWIDSIIDKY